MKLVAIVTAGIAGTTLMTAFMYATTFLTGQVMKVVKILGTMLTFQTSLTGQLSDSRRAIFWGTLAHYAIGVGFVLCYYVLWSWGIGRPDISSGFLFGLGSGVAAVVFWYAFFMLHPNPPAIPLKPYLFTLFIAHIIFTYVVIGVYNGVRS